MSGPAPSIARGGLRKRRPTNQRRLPGQKPAVAPLTQEFLTRGASGAIGSPCSCVNAKQLPRQAWVDCTGIFALRQGKIGVAVDRGTLLSAPPGGLSRGERAARSVIAHAVRKRSELCAFLQWHVADAGAARRSGLSADDLSGGRSTELLVFRVGALLRAAIEAREMSKPEERAHREHLRQAPPPGAR